MAIAGEVAIIGSATTAFGVHHDRGYLDLLAEAAFGAIADAGLDLDRIGSAWLGTAEPGLTGLVGDSGGGCGRGDRVRAAPRHAGRQLLLHRAWRPFARPRSTSRPASTSWCSRSAPRRCAT